MHGMQAPKRFLIELSKKLAIVIYWFDISRWVPFQKSGENCFWLHQVARSVITYFVTLSAAATALVTTLPRTRQ